MARQRHLLRAPIAEAVIDIRVTPKDGLTFAELQRAFTDLGFGYYVKNPIAEGRFGFQMSIDGTQPQTMGESTQIGLRLHSNDEKYVAQCGLHGFTLSRLPPYENWPTFLAEAKRVWNIYAERLLPMRANRIGTRFINNLQLPMQEGESYQKYFIKLVDFPDEVPQALTSFLQRFHTVDIESRASVILTLALDRTPLEPPVPVILDVDASNEIPLELPSQAHWDILEHLRTLKNRCFFGVITETTAQLYE